MIDAIGDIPSDTQNCFQVTVYVSENDKIVFKEFTFEKTIGRRAANVTHVSEQLPKPYFIYFHETPSTSMQHSAVMFDRLS